MILSNRVIAVEGPRRKDGTLQDYSLKSTVLSEPFITWGHPPDNDPDRKDIVGRIFNHRLKDGKLSADLHIWEDRLSAEQLDYLKDHQDVSIGYWYKMEGNTREIMDINHVAIGIEKGVCSPPTCGLNVAADSEGRLYTDEILEENSLTGQNEKKPDSDAAIKIAVLEEQLAGAKAELAQRDADAVDSLVTVLGKRLGQDTCAFKGLDLATLRTFDKLTQKVDVAHGGGFEIEKIEKDKNKEEGQDDKKDSLSVKGPWAKDDYIGAVNLG
jgi:hypothetical protein